MKNGRLKLGIVGGLGARGGADILNKLVAATPVKSEGDHREIIFEQKPLSEPVPVSSSDYAPVHRKFYVFDTLSRMEQSGCDAALLPCFVTHTFLDELKAELPIELISIGEAIAEEIWLHHPNALRIGILTTPYVRRSGFFERLLSSDQEIVYPDARAELAMLDAIYGPDGFKAGGDPAHIVAQVESAITSLVDQGVDIIIPGMTELPILLGACNLAQGLHILDVNDIYARFALGKTDNRRPPVFKIGIVGGVGPAATVDFLRKIVEATAAERDQDHVKLIVEQNPQIPDRTDNLVNGGPDPTLALYGTCKKLQNAGAHLIAIPCNTAHAFVDRIQRHLDIPIVNILAVTAQSIAALEPKARRIAILATNGTVASGLYQAALEKEGLEPILPGNEAQELLMDAIYGARGVKAGFTSGLCSDQLAQVIAEVSEQGADAAILGCTELPLIELSTKPALRLFDPTDILAQACVEAALLERGASLRV